MLAPPLAGENPGNCLATEEEVTVVEEEAEEEGSEEKLAPKAEKLAKSLADEGAVVELMVVGGATDGKLVFEVGGLEKPPIPKGSNEKSPAPDPEPPVVVELIAPEEKRRGRGGEREREEKE